MTIASCGALFAGRLADWHAQTERLWARLKDSVFSAKDMAALGYDMLDTSRLSPLEALAKLYGFNLTTVAGRAALIEEHMARVAEAGIKPAWWTAVIARIKDALKRLGFGPGQTTDDEIARLLSLARKAEKDKGTAGNITRPMSQQKIPKRTDKPQSWSGVRPGHKWDSAKQFLPKLLDGRPASPIPDRMSWVDRIRAAAHWLKGTPTATDPWGATVAIHNPQTNGVFQTKTENQAAHLLGAEAKKGTEVRTPDQNKINWFGAIETTIKDAQVRVVNDHHKTYYFRSYKEGVHMVIVENMKVSGSYGLVSQYAPESLGLVGARVEKTRPDSGPAAQGSPSNVGIPVQPQTQTAQAPTLGANAQSGSNSPGVKLSQQSRQG